MAVKTINFEDKQFLNENSNIADVNKVTDNDINEIKKVVNNNANETKILNKIIKGLKGQILWTNSDPTVNFTGQNVTLSSSDYDTLKILYYDYRANRRMQSVTIKKGENANLVSVFLTDNQLYMATRHMDYIDDTHYTFNNCSSVTSKSITALNGSSPAQCIPTCIIGYNTELFN